MTASAVALIPARSGSTRVPGKNVRELRGHPLIAYTIAAARDSGVFGAVVVSTDSEEIAAVARRYGAEVPWLRPAALAGPRSPDIEWVRHALAGLPAFDAFSILRPTSPFRTQLTIRRAWERFTELDVDSLRAIRPCREHPGKMWVVTADDAMTPLLGQPAGTPLHSRQYADLPTRVRAGLEPRVRVGEGGARSRHHRRRAGGAVLSRGRGGLLDRLPGGLGAGRANGGTASGARRTAVTTVALVGCGRWGRHVLRDLVTLGCEVVVTARSDESRARAEDGGAALVVRSVADLPAVDGAVVCYPDHHARARGRRAALERSARLRREAAHRRPGRRACVSPRGRTGPSVRDAQVALPPGHRGTGRDRDVGRAGPGRRGPDHPRRMGQPARGRRRRLDARSRTTSRSSSRCSARSRLRAALASSVWTGS